MKISPSKYLCFLGLVAVGLILGFASGGKTILAQSGSSTRAAGPTDSRQKRQLRGEQRQVSDHRLREGTRISDQLGYFKQSGDGAAFVTKENHKFGGLPNLNLQRVLRMLKGTEEPESVQWSVSGTVTEFDGKNYLLIGRAVYKSNVLPPAPERISE